MSDGMDMIAKLDFDWTTDRGGLTVKHILL